MGRGLRCLNPHGAQVAGAVSRGRGRGALQPRQNRASAPTRVSERLAQEAVALIVHFRRTLRRTGAGTAAELGRARPTVPRWLRREGLGRPARIDPPEPVRRFQRARPGELIHPDIKKLGRFDRPGHRVAGARTGWRNRGAGRVEPLSATGPRTMAWRACRRR